MMRSSLYAVLMLLLTIMMSACRSEVITSQDIDQIKLELMSQTEHSHGIAYTVKLKNLSTYKIVQNNMYLSYPIQMTNGSKTNDFKLIARNNKLHIKSGEEVTVTFFAPIEVYEGNQKLDRSTPNFEIIGYMEEVKEERRFQKSGPIEFYNP